MLNQNINEELIKGAVPLVPMTRYLMPCSLIVGLDVVPALEKAQQFRVILAGHIESSCEEVGVVLDDVLDNSESLDTAGELHNNAAQ